MMENITASMVNVAKAILWQSNESRLLNLILLSITNFIVSCKIRNYTYNNSMSKFSFKFFKCTILYKTIYE